MKLTIEQLTIEQLRNYPMNPRLAYNEETGNFLDAQVQIHPLFALFIVGNINNKSALRYVSLEFAIEKFNHMESEYYKNSTDHCCVCCGAKIAEERLKVCNKCASEFEF